MIGSSDSIVAQAVRSFLAPILDLWEDPTVTEILINGPDVIFVERKGILYKTDKKFPSEDALRAAVTNIAQSVGRRIDDEEPRLDARLPDGSRVAAVIPPCSRQGTVVSIRKFTFTKVTLKEYVQWGALSAPAAAFLQACVWLGKNTLVSGGTGSGKTTLLGLLASMIPNHQRILVIEDASELKITHDHVVFFETRQPNAMGKGAVTMRDLLRSALRLRPDRIIVGEVRGVEALELIQAMNTGHKGSMGTIHANSPEDAIVRLEALASGAEAGLSEKALRYQVAGAVELIVQVSRLHDGSRRVTHIAEVVGLTPDGYYDVRTLFHIPRLIKQPDGKFKGELLPTGRLPTFIEELKDHGFGITEAFFTPPSISSENR